MRKQKFVFLILIAALLFTGCGRTPVVNINHLQNDVGDYQYEELSWGCDKKAAEAALGITLDQTVNNSANLQSYMTTGAYSLNGLPAVVTCEFDTTGLCALTFRVTPTAKEIESYWDGLTAALTSRYGSVDPIYLDTGSNASQGASKFVTPSTVQSETYLWDNSGTMHTALIIRKVSVNSKTPTVELSVYVIPADRTE